MNGQKNRSGLCRISNRLLTIALYAAGAPAFLGGKLSFAVPSGAQAQQPAAISSRRIGAIKAINGTAITLTPDSGADISVTVQPATRIVRIAPGEKDLKNATPIQLQDLQ